LVTLTFGSCPAVSACGGSLLGTWFYTAGCINNPFSEATSQCGAATTSNNTGTVRGQVTFTPATITRDALLNITGSVHFPSSCLSAVVTCASLNVLVAQYYPGSTCTAAGGGGCDCAMTRSTRFNELALAYSVSGNTLTVGTGTYDFCVSPASTFKYTRTGGPSLEDGLLTLTLQ
jgi:hypothetical protein